MKRPAAATILGGLALACAGFAWADEKFESVSVRLEQNVSDHDAEIVFRAISGDPGLATLKVTAPDGRTLVDFKSPDTKVGFRHLDFESPEAKDLAKLLLEFPAGEYTFTGITVTGVNLSGKALLSHRLPPAVSLVRPRPDEENVPVKGFRVRWGTGRNLASHVLSIENEQTGVEQIKATLPGVATTYVVPDSVLRSGTKYKLSLGAVTQDGNASFVETTFTTAKK